MGERVCFHFFRIFREDSEVARCWWDMAREEYGHVGILKMVQELVSPEDEAGEIGTRLWSLVDVVEGCEQEALAVDSPGRALELAVRIESSELDVLGHRIVQSLRAQLPEGAARPFTAADAHCQRLVEAVGKVPDTAPRQRLEIMLGGPRVARWSGVWASDGYI